MHKFSTASNTIGTSSEVTCNMIIAGRNRHLANLMNNFLFESKLKSFRFSLIEQRKYLLLAYGSMTGDDIRIIILVLFNCTNAFMELLSIEGGPLTEFPRDTMKEEIGITVSVSLITSEENTRRYGIHGTYVMEHDFSRESTKKVVKSDPSIYFSATG